jgi:hypothetical protein
VTGPDPFPTQLLDRLRELVGRGWVVHEEKDQAERLVFWDSCDHCREIEPSRPEDELDRAYWRLRHQDPLCGYQQRTGDLTAHKLSDFVTRRQWHRIELYAEYHRFWGNEGRMQIGLAATPLNKKFLFFSGDWEFGERERLLLNLLRPHLTALEAAAQQRRLAAALAPAGARRSGTRRAGLVGRHRVRDIDRGAAPCPVLRRYLRRRPTRASSRLAAP